MRLAKALTVGIFAGILTGLLLLPIPKSTLAQHTPAQIPDPCFSQFSYKSSASISVTSATTTQLVAPSAGKVVYVCGVSMTIAPSATSADVASFTTGTGATCGTNTVTNTGTFGNGDLTTAAPPLFVSFADPGSTFTSASGAGLCMISAGNTVNIQGVLSYVQQ